MKKSKEEDKKTKDNVEKKKITIPDLKEDYWDDIHVKIDRLKGIVPKIFFAYSTKGMYIPQICFMIFKSDRYPFHAHGFYGVFLRYFLNIKNPKDIIAVSMHKKNSYIYEYGGNTDRPFRMKFLDENINNAILITFTEEDGISCDIQLLLAKDRPAFDVDKDLKFYDDFALTRMGYTPYIITSKREDYKKDLRIVHIGYKITN